MRTNKIIVAVLGCVPVVGTVIGIGRIVNELQKIRQHRVYNTALSFFEALNELNSGKKILRGICEIIPIAGPLAFGAVKLYQAHARKANAKAKPILVPNQEIDTPPLFTPPTSPIIPPQPTPAPISTITPTSISAPPQVSPEEDFRVALEGAVDLANIDSCETLRQYVGKKIRFNAHYNTRTNRPSNENFTIPHMHVGVLHSVSAPVDKKYTIQLNAISYVFPRRVQTTEMTFIVSDVELQAANRSL